MKRPKSPAESIGFAIGWDIAEVRECRYQPTKYAKIHVYTIGDWYYCATLRDQAPPDGWDWQLVNQSSYHGRKIYRAS